MSFIREIILRAEDLVRDLNWQRRCAPSHGVRLIQFSRLALIFLIRPMQVALLEIGTFNDIYQSIGKGA